MRSGPGRSYIRNRHETAIPQAAHYCQRESVGQIWPYAVLVK